MNSMKPAQWAGLATAVAFVLWTVYSHFQYFGDVSFLGAALLIEIIIFCLWKFEGRFFPLLMVAFLWAGMNVPMQGAWTGGRWLILAAGAATGYIVWMKVPRSHFKTIHLLAFFCVISAFVSASVSPFVQMASYKALSLLLLLLYCSSGMRLAALGREQRFFNGLLVACEVVAYGAAVFYLALGQSIFGNPNSLGAAMSIGVFPVLLWGWLTTTGPIVRTRRLVALLLCVYLIFFSMARAGMVSMIVVTIICCSCLRQYKVVIKFAGFVLFLVAVGGMVAPDFMGERFSGLKDAILYKGHKEEGVLGSRKTPWEESIATIKQHPLFGTGYGTSPTGEDPGLGFGRFASSAETAREHGSSYMTIAEWVGLLGVVPFAGLIGLTAANVWRVCVWMRKTANPYHYAIPLAMVLLAGFVHAGFEDWLFAVGAYPSVYFWAFAFLLADLMPETLTSPVPSAYVRIAPRTEFGAAVPNR